MTSTLAHCPKCGNEFVLGLPADMEVVIEAGRAFAKVHRKRCKAETLMGAAVKPINDRRDWLASGDTGISSRTIYAVMTGNREGWYDVPRDTADFGRCYRLLKLYPEWLPRLPEVATRFPEWAPLVRNWDRLASLYERDLASGKSSELYAEIQRLNAEARA